MRRKTHTVPLVDTGDAENIQPFKTHPLLHSLTASHGQNGLRVGGKQLVKCFTPKHYRIPSHSLGSLDQPGHHEVCMHADLNYSPGDHL